MNGSGLAFCSIDEAWGGKATTTTPEELYNTKTTKPESTNLKKLIPNMNEIDRYSENHNGPLRKANGPSAANASIRGMKPMEYGSNHQHTLDSGNLNPFFKSFLFVRL